MTYRKSVLLALALLLCNAQQCTAQSRQDWIDLGAHVHGGFGAFLPIGIRIGLDALDRLHAKPRDVTVVYYDNDKAPCACISDGIMIATVASPGQRTLTIAAEKAPETALAVAVIHDKQTGKSLRYTVPFSWMAKVIEWNKDFDPAGRYDAAMQADGLFQVEALE